MARRVKLCGGCQKTKPFSDFSPCSRGKVYRGAAGRKSICKPCAAEYMRGFYKRNPDSYEKMKRRNRQRRIDDPVRAILERARARAKKLDLPFKLERKHLEPLPARCPVLGTRLKYDAHVNDPATASLDRIDNRKGYVSGNVVIVSFFVNGVKRDATAAQLRKIADFYARK